MDKISKTFNRAVGAVCLIFASSLYTAADEARLEELFGRLQTENLAEWEEIQNEIWNIWSQSGSDSMDLLLKRGRDAIEEGDMEAAIEHLTALTDHAPDFAEGYNARATAFFHAGLLGPSLEDLRRALALNPQHFGAMAGLGTILMELGREAQAFEAYKRAYELNPHRPDLKDAVETLGAKHDGRDA